MTKVLLVLAMIMLPYPAYAQESKQLPLGWDLTYSSLLNANHVGRDEWIRKWLENPDHRSPVKQLISKWRDDPIRSSILLEHPAFHAGERTTIWLVRTTNHAYYLELHEGMRHELKEKLSPDVYDKYLAFMTSWQQKPPLKSEDTPANGIPGYMGFLSFYDRGTSRQMLLTLEDFFLCETKKCDKFKLGRVFQALAILPRFKVLQRALGDG